MSAQRFIKKAQVIFHEQAPWIPVAHSVGFAPLSPRVKGYVQSPFGYDAFYGVSGAKPTECATGIHGACSWKITCACL